MKTIEIKIYSFDELSEKAKEKAIENLSDINTDLDWWDTVYEDAKTIGLKITGFDLDRSRHATGDFILSAQEVAQNILNNHGEACETYKTADSFLEYFNPLFAEYLDEDSEHYESRDREQELQELEDDFLKSLLEDYSIILQKEYEFLISEEAIIESIRANEYDFTENGEEF